MSTSPNNLQQNPPLVPGELLTIERKALGAFHFLEHHLVVAVLALGIAAALVYGAVSTVDGIIARHDEKKDALLEKVLAQKEADQKALLERMDSDKTANDARDAQKQATIDNLLAQMQADHAALADRIKKDAALDAQSAAARLVEQEHAQPGQAKASGDSVIVDLPLTRLIVADLDRGAQAQKDVTNVSAQLDAQKVLTDDARKNFENAQKVIAADKDTLIAQIQADDASCKVKVDKANAAGNKKGFWGYVAGVASILFLRH